MKATGIVRRIDDLGRIVVPKEIRRTLRIREGDALEIFTDREGEIILKKYSPLGEMGNFADQYAESLAQVSGRAALITDRDQFIAVAGGFRTFLGKSISKELEVNGVGYRVAKEGKNLVMNLGYSHQVIVPEIDGITIDVPTQNKIVISGPDKQKVGQFAAEVREKRPPEPYKGKGIKYVDEVIRRKVGKTGAKK